MQRKTKFKIILYSIGFISFALLPYILTKQEADSNQRYAALPSYQISDSVHPFLGKLKQVGSGISGLFSSKSDGTQTPENLDSLSALNEEASNEVLASLAPQGTAAAKRTTARSSAAAAGTEANAPATAAAASDVAPEGASEAAAAENGVFPQNSNFSSGRAASYNNYAADSGASRFLNATGKDQRFSQTGNMLRKGSKSSSEMDNLIAQNDTRLAKMRFWGKGNPSGKAARGKSSSKGKGSSKARARQAKSSLNESAAMRASARSGSKYKYTAHGLSTIPPADLQRERMLQQQELAAIYLQQYEDVVQEAHEEQQAAPAPESKSRKNVVGELMERSVDMIGNDDAFPEQGNAEVNLLTENKTENKLLQAAWQAEETPSNPQDNSSDKLNVAEEIPFTPEETETFDDSFENIAGGLDDDTKIPLVVIGDKADPSFINKETNRKSLSENPEQVPGINPIKDQEEKLKEEYNNKGCEEKPCFFVATVKAQSGNTVTNVLDQNGFTHTSAIPNQSKQAVPNEKFAWTVNNLEEMKDFLEQNPSGCISCSDKDSCTILIEQTGLPERILFITKTLDDTTSEEYINALKERYDENTRTMEEKAKNDAEAAQNVIVKQQLEQEISQKK